MRAISVRQPWAYCILHAGKVVENRTWPMPISLMGHGTALHASKAKPSKRDCEFVRSQMGIELPDDLPLGAIVGVFNPVGCVEITDSGLFSYVGSRPYPGYLASSDKWFFGPFGHLYADAQSLPTPIAARGMLGYWKVERATAKEILAQANRTWSAADLLANRGMSLRG